MTTNYTPLRSRKPLPDMSALNGSQLKRLGGTGAKLGCCVVSADGSLVFGNAGFCALLGYGADVSKLTEAQCPIVTLAGDAARDGTRASFKQTFVTGLRRMSTRCGAIDPPIESSLPSQPWWAPCC